MPVILKNNAFSTLATAITASDTGIVVADGSKFPALSAGEYFYATLVSPAGTTEIVKVTARISNSLTVVRAQDGSSAASFQVGARLDMRVNAASMNDLVDEHDQAAEISIADAGGYYTSGVVEGALQEVGADLRTQAAQVRDTVAALLADTVLTYTAGQAGTVTTDDIVRTRAEGFSYKVAASGATDQHVTTAGGVKLYVVQGQEGFDVKAFGATGDGVTDDSDAVEATILAAYLAAPLLNGMRRGAAVKFPNGRYRIAQSSKLFSSLPSTVAGAGSFHFSGNGPSDSYASRGGASVLVFDPPTASTTEYLINNNNKIAWCRFRNLGFVSNNGGTFWDGPTGSGVQSFEFRDCAFKDFVDIFNIGGGSNNSEWSFFACKFSGFSGRAFYLNNQQAVNWRFFGCDAEVFSGVLFEFARGSNIAWYSGSIIPITSAARIVKVPSGATGIGLNNVPSILFDAVRFEMRDGAWMFEKIASTPLFDAVFRDCNMGGFSIPTSPSIPKVLYWRGAGQVTFSRCRNMGNYLWDYSTPGDQAAAISQLNIIMDDCDVGNNYIPDSSFVLSSATSNTIRHPLFDVDRCGERFDGIYRPRGGSFANFAAKPRSISFSTQSSRIQLVAIGAGWPQITDLYLPPVLVQKVGFFPLNTSDFGATSNTITIKDKAGATLWTVTYTMNAVPAPSETLIFKKLTNTDEYLRFEFSSSYVGGAAVPFVGALFLHY